MINKGEKKLESMRKTIVGGWEEGLYRIKVEERKRRD